MARPPTRSRPVALASYRPLFVEAPVPPENVDALAEICTASPVPMATGERLVPRFEFREVFEKQARHVIQPDLCHLGGSARPRRCRHGWDLLHGRRTAQSAPPGRPRCRAAPCPQHAA